MAIELLSSWMNAHLWLCDTSHVLAFRQTGNSKDHIARCLLVSTLNPTRCDVLNIPKIDPNF